ncbi:MAG: hypothetical protein ACPGU5_03275 [Lishizhenia sp.]
MKYLSALLLITLLASCATRIPYTEKIRQDFELDATKIKSVQFYTSQTVVLEKSSSKGTKTTEADGGLVVNESSQSERIIIPISTPCVFEEFEEDGSVLIRFERGSGKVIRFALKENINNGRYYLQAVWRNGKGEVEYGNEIYFTSSKSANTFLTVKLKKWQQNKRKDRVVKGMKVK